MQENSKKLCAEFFYDLEWHILVTARSEKVSETRTPYCTLHILKLLIILFDSFLNEGGNKSILTKLMHRVCKFPRLRKHPESVLYYCVTIYLAILLQM